MAAKIIATWQGNAQLGQNISNFDRQMKYIIAGQVKYAENDAVAYAKKNAPWTDQTGNARSGLHAKAEITPEYAQLTVAHSEPYGIWLEVRWGGKFAIIGPTIFFVGKLILSRIESSIKKMEAMNA